MRIICRKILLVVYQWKRLRIIIIIIIIIIIELSNQSTNYLTTQLTN
jgi:hypothetical protein